MKNYINTALLALLIVLSTIYFINCRQIIVRKADEVLEMYREINCSLEEPDTAKQAAQEEADKTGNKADGFSDSSGNSIETATMHSDVPDGYYVTLIDDMIVVTLGDKETVLEHTGISAEGLEVSDIDKLEKGIFVDDLVYVFNILESLSS